MTAPTIEPASPMVRNVARLWCHLTAPRRRRLLGLLGLMLASAAAEVMSLGALAPFLAAIAAPQTILAYPAAASLARSIGITTPAQLQLPLAGIFVISALVSAALRLVMLRATSRVGVAVGSEIAVDLYRRTLYQPYVAHLARNSSDVVSVLLNKVDLVMHGVVHSALTLLTSTLLFVALTVTLLLIDARLASIAAASFGVSYAIIIFLTRRFVRQNSIVGARSHAEVVRTVQEGLGGIRDVLLDGTQPVFAELFRRADLSLRLAHARITVAAQSPRHLLEACGISLIAALAYASSQRTGGLGDALPVLGTLALGVQRLLPALQQGYHSWTMLAGHQGALTDTLDLLEQPLPTSDVVTAAKPLPLESVIEFQNVHFRYASDGPWIIERLNLSIPKGARVGLVGATGSGKSTAVDLLMGLLTPALGHIRVDGTAIDGPRVRRWQTAIAHVPQSIFLADASVAENIAFGIPRDRIDMDRVHRAASQAQLASFIEALPEGYATSVGERGARLSGGQRQRIGIARALYKGVPVLVFDEATSALDAVTEESLMTAFDSLGPDCTIVFVAHRLSTVRHCDLIVELHKGRVVATGTYDELLALSPTFRALTGLTGRPHGSSIGYVADAARPTGR